MTTKDKATQRKLSLLELGQEMSNLSRQLLAPPISCGLRLFFVLMPATAAVVPRLLD